MVAQKTSAPTWRKDMTTQHNLITPEDAAGILNVSVRTMAKWRSTGYPEIPYVKIGRCVRYRKNELEAFICKNSTYASAEVD